MNRKIKELNKTISELKTEVSRIYTSRNETAQLGEMKDELRKELMKSFRMEFEAEKESFMADIRNKLRKEFESEAKEMKKNIANIQEIQAGHISRTEFSEGLTRIRAGIQENDEKMRSICADTEDLKKKCTANGMTNDAMNLHIKETDLSTATEKKKIREKMDKYDLTANSLSDRVASCEARYDQLSEITLTRASNDSNELQLLSKAIHAAEAKISESERNRVTREYTLGIINQKEAGLSKKIDEITLMIVEGEKKVREINGRVENNHLRINALFETSSSPTTPNITPSDSENLRKRLEVLLDGKADNSRLQIIEENCKAMLKSATSSVEQSVKTLEDSLSNNLRDTANDLSKRITETTSSFTGELQRSQSGWDARMREKADLSKVTALTQRVNELEKIPERAESPMPLRYEESAKYAIAELEVMSKEKIPDILTKVEKITKELKTTSSLTNNLSKRMDEEVDARQRNNISLNEMKIQLNGIKMWKESSESTDYSSDEKTMSREDITKILPDKLHKWTQEQIIPHIDNTVKEFEKIRADELTKAEKKWKTHSADMMSVKEECRRNTFSIIDLRKDLDSVSKITNNCVNDIKKMSETIKGTYELPEKVDALTLKVVRIEESTVPSLQQMIDVQYNKIEDEMDDLEKGLIKKMNDFDEDVKAQFEEAAKKVEQSTPPTASPKVIEKKPAETKPRPMNRLIGAPIGIPTSIGAPCDNPPLEYNGTEMDWDESPNHAFAIDGRSAKTYNDTFAGLARDSIRNIPVYSDAKSSIDITVWIQKIERIVHEAGLHKNYCTTVASDKCNGELARVLRNREARYGNRDTWDTIKAHIINRFTGHSTKSEFMDAWKKITCANRTGKTLPVPSDIYLYWDKHDEALLRILRHLPTERHPSIYDQVEVYINGLPDEWQTILRTWFSKNKDATPEEIMTESLHLAEGARKPIDATMEKKEAVSLAIAEQPPRKPRKDYEGSTKDSRPSRAHDNTPAEKKRYESKNEHKSEERSSYEGKAPRFQSQRYEQRGRGNSYRSGSNRGGGNNYEGGHRHQSPQRKGRNYDDTDDRRFQEERKTNDDKQDRRQEQSKKKEAIPRANSCFTCGSDDHYSFDCKEKIPECKVCGGGHITSAHEMVVYLRKRNENFRTYVKGDEGSSQKNSDQEKQSEQRGRSYDRR